MEELFRVGMREITKRFEGVKALNAVNLQVRPGEIHALMGENGAGKSTLMRVLSGAIQKDSGRLFLDGKEVSFANPKQAIEHGISVIYQEFALVYDLTVAENIFIDSLSQRRGIIDWKTLKKRAKERLDQLGFSNINVNHTVRDLSVAYQQIVEICKAVTRNCSVLVLDEPTAVLASYEVEQLFRLLRDFKKQGISIIYISHRIEEAMELCDRVTVLKDGANVNTMNISAINKHQLVNMMIGRELQNFFPAREPKIRDVKMRVENISRGKEVKNVSFEVRRGEVLGIGGLVGAGRTELIRAIFAADKRDSGDIYIDGIKASINSPKDAVRHGIGLLPEDRKTQGVLLNLPIKYNITLPSLKKFCNFLNTINFRKELAFSREMAANLRIKLNSLEDIVSSLSGGNQQKVALSKLLASDCEVLLMDEPTRGVDVGAKMEIYRIINSLVERGFAIVVVSSEMTEIIGMCDRALIMKGGEIAGELSREQLTEQNMIHYSMGVGRS
ncbi:MAG: sugar ABC transporter ATP-binding protein [Treponema sp.]|jgi:ribose transport system ATP-binding protein|nr:sugar ABC transporter ATP-binding protein [Treponema sp.]